MTMASTRSQTVAEEDLHGIFGFATSTRDSTGSRRLTSSHGSSSSSRSRTRSSSSGRRHSRRHRRHRRHRKVSERNFVAAAFSMIAVVCTCTALAKSECFTLHGGDCHDGDGSFLTTLGISNFFFIGKFVDANTYNFNAFGQSHFLVNCVDAQTVHVMRGIIALCTLSTLLTLISFVLDLVGPKQRHLMVVRRNGILNIMAVFMMILVTGLCYWASLLLFANLHSHKRAKGSKVSIDFGISYYILVGGTVANIIATASNLLRRYPPRTTSNTDTEQTRPMLSDVDLLNDDSPVPSSLMVHEPPPYTP